MTIGLLDSDVSSNYPFMKVLPDDYEDYMHTGSSLPILAFNQFKRAYIHDINEISYTVNCKEPSDATRKNYVCYIHPGKPGKIALIGGDSGNPAFLMLDDEPILLTVWHAGGYGNGTSIAAIKDDINAMMNQLGGGYQLSEYDLSGYKRLREPLGE